MDFPRTTADLNRTATNLFNLVDIDTANISSRRRYFCQLSEKFRDGDILPKIEYTESEIATWRYVFKTLTALYPSHAIDDFLKAFRLLVANGLYSELSVPQFGPLSKFMEQTSDFSIRPVGGMLTPRHFLAGLALRVFHATPHVRPFDEVFNAEEPDICHELLGHVPMLLNRDFADFSQVSFNSHMLIM